MGSCTRTNILEIKKELVKPTVLALYNSKARTKVADASSHGLGAVLLQEHDGKPVAYTSIALSD